MTSAITAPFTSEQVQALADYQDHGLGHPFTVADAMEWSGYESEAEARDYVTELFQQWLNDELPGGAGPAGTPWSSERRNWINDHIGDLTGRDLACWCPLPAPGQPDHCHGAVLLATAAEGPGSTNRRRLAPPEAAPAPSVHRTPERASDGRTAPRTPGRTDPSADPAT